MDIINVFHTVILSSLMASIITLMILIVKGVFRDKLNPSFHYYIWLILLIKLIVPFGPQTPLNISNIYEKFHVQSTANENVQKTQIKTSQQIKNVILKDPISADTFQSLNKNTISNNINISSINKGNIEKVLFLIWLLGAVFYVFILFIGNKKLRGIVRDSIKNINGTHKEILYNCMSTMNIRAEVEISYSTKVNTPSLCGLIKPQILIPVSVAENVSNEEFRYIIIHELCHLKNKDLFINWIINLLSAIYWFNPVLLYGFHRMRQECEFSCDSRVIPYLNKDENIQYGNTIIRILELGGNNKRLIGATSMAMNSSEIKRRIIMISKYKKMSIKSVSLGIVVFAILGSLGISMNISKASEDKTVTVNNTISNAPQEIIPSSSDIVIYNSHPDEEYPSGKKITDVSVSINDRLTKEGISSRFIKSNPPTQYEKSYQTTRDLIIKNVEGYSNTILLDIHRDVTENTKSNTKKILFVLAKSSPYYEENKKFVDSLLNNINNSSDVKLDIVVYNSGISYFNQDLSKSSVLVEIGNNMSSDSDIEECINALVSGLKNTQKALSN